jgi:hypothetical protein
MNLNQLAGGQLLMDTQARADQYRAIIRSRSGRLCDLVMQSPSERITASRIIEVPNRCVSDPIWMSYEKDRGDN